MMPSRTIAERSRRAKWRRTQISRLHREGKSIDEIAETLGISRRTVFRGLARKIGT